MRIRSFHIDGYGIFANVSIEALTPGLSIFLGDNEAGKSTCLDFFRAMLTGYPPSNSKKHLRNGAPLRGGQGGGSLQLETRKHGVIRLSRRQGGNGGIVTLTDADGTLLDNTILDQLFSGVTRDVYRNVFGFSLNELQSFDSLNSDDVRHALYGASFGMGIRPPGEVLKKLSAGMDALFRPQASSKIINTLLKQWNDVRARIDAAQQDAALYDALSLQRDDTVQALERLRAERRDTEHLRRTAEKQLGVWKQWDEWRTAKGRLDRLEMVPDTFPQGGALRLERANDALMAAARDVDALREIHERVLAQKEAIVINVPLLELLPRLQNLAERKSSYRTAQNALPSQHDAVARARGELHRLLSTLGPDWTCDRIRATNRSLFTREEIEKHASLMQEANATHKSRISILEKANRDVEMAEHALRNAAEAYDSLPVPAAVLDANERETLRRSLTRMESLQQLLPEKQQALKNASATFSRAYAPLNLRKNIPPAQALNELGAAQAQALTLAEEARQAVKASQDKTHDLTQAQKAEEDTRARIDRLRRKQSATQGPSRESIDNRAAAIRVLRQLYGNICAEKSRMEEAEMRLKALVAPAPLKSIPLIAIGVMLMLAGAAILAARWYGNITEFAVTPDLVLPMTLWSGYLVVLTGVGFLAGGLPRSGPEAERHTIEAEQLRNRKDACTARVLDLEAQMQEQCVLAEVPSPDPVTLDATELRLERDREQCVTDERLSDELALLEEELTALHENTARIQQDYNEAAYTVQETRKRWHEYLQGCHVESIPAPESAPAFFAHADGARMALDSRTALEEEVAHLEKQLDDLRQSALAIPVVAEHKAAVAEQDNELTALQAGIRSVLDACREADAAEEERLKAAAALHSAELNQERAAMAQGEAMDALRASEDTCGAAQEGWSGMLADLGLGLNLSPASALEAFEYMERSLTAEANVAHQEDEVARMERERDALVQPVQQIEHDLHRPLPDDPEDRIDWAQRLDALLQDAQDMADADHERRLIAARVEEQHDKLQAAERVLTDARSVVDDLLHKAGVSDAESYLRLAAAQEQRQEIRQRMGDLEDTLRMAAGDTPLETFVEAFAEGDQRDREIQLRDADTLLSRLEEQEQELVTQNGDLTNRLTALATESTLADLRQQEAGLREALHNHAAQWSRYALAHALLSQAKQRFEKERQPQVIRMASEIFAAITEGRWTGLTASLEDNSISVLPPHGEPVSPAVLSRGTQEQIYLAMRLAYIRNHTEQAAALPIIMDDILVNFDPARARRTAEALLDITFGKHGGAEQQVLFFTCHPHIADMLQDVMPQSGRYLVQDGTIAQA